MPGPEMSFEPCFSTEETIRIARRGGAAASRAIDELCRRFGPLIRGTVRRFRVPKEYRDDATQAGYLGLLESIHHFDVGRATAFESFAMKHVAGAIRRAIFPNRRVAKDTGLIEEWETLERVVHERGAPLDWTALDPKRADPWQACAARQDATAVIDFMDRLDERERRLIIGKYWQEQSQTDLARQIGISKMSVTRRFQKLYAAGREQLSAHRVALAA